MKENNNLPQSNEMLQNSKLYEFAIELKKHTEERRDDINKYYTSLFTAIISVMPFINKIIDKSPLPNEYFASPIFIFLSFVGLILSISWVRAIEQIRKFLTANDEFLMKMERKDNKSYLLFIAEQLHQDVPGKVTKQEMWIPYTFVFIFFMSIVGGIIGMAMTFR